MISGLGPQSDTL